MAGQSETALALNRIDGFRRQAETRLRESAQEIRATLYGLGDGVLAVDPGGRLIHMNPVAEHLTGWTEAEAIGRPLEEVFRIISEETEQRVENPVPRVLRDGKIVGLANHTLLIARDGTQRAIADSGAPVFDDQGDIVRVVLVFRDQTAERAAQRALTEAERMARGTLDGLSEHIAILDEAGTIQAVNGAWRQFALDNPPLNAPVCEGANYFQVCAVALGEDAASAAAFAEGIRCVMEGRQVDYLQEYACHSPEEQRWFLGQVTRFAGAGPVRVVVSHKNITERKIAENHLRAKTELLSLTGAMAKVGGWEFDTTSLVATWTDEVSRIYGLDTIHEIAIESAIEFYAEASRPVLQKALRAASEAGEPYDLELVLISAKGDRKMVRTMGKPVRDQNGKIVRVQGIIQDITERKLVESQIKAAQVEAQRLLGIADQSRKALLSLVEDQRIAQEEIRRLNTDLEHRVSVRTLELEAANKELEAFAYSVSHDLRAPLRHMDGFLSMLAHHLGADLKDKGAHYLDVAQRASVRMAQLVDGLLSFSRLGRTELRVVAIDTVNLLNSVIEEFKGDCAERVIRWDLGPLPVLHGDPTLIRLVFQNLVGNALKFTRGRLETVIEIQPIEGLAGETGVMIRDNGVGFDPAYIHKLFGVFQRLHREEEFEGTGIGLANVHRIVSRHRGRVWAEGRLGQGAAFYITLPITGEGS